MRTLPASLSRRYYSLNVHTAIRNSLLNMKYNGGQQRKELARHKYQILGPIR